MALRPLPCAVRPFADEAFGSWVGRLAGQYRMSVGELDSEYALDLPWSRRLGWLAAGPYHPHTIEALANVARIDAARLQALEARVAWCDAKRAAYCPCCIFLNPVDVTQPFWKSAWLDPKVIGCDLHRQRLMTLPSASVRCAANMTRLIKAVGTREQARRHRARFSPY
jgi:hypothetical protein